MADTNTANTENTTQTTGTQGSTEPTGTNAAAANQQTQNTDHPAPAFDYEKLAALITGKQSVTEDTVLKSYFKQQGLTAEELDQAIKSFKQQKAANTPDASALQSQLAQSQRALMKARTEQEAMLLAAEIGVEMKNVPYLMKLADLSKVTAENGEVNKEELKTALTKVLEDVPGLKASATASSGFTQVGAGVSGNGQQQNAQPQASQVASKRWNRFN